MQSLLFAEEDKSYRSGTLRRSSIFIEDNIVLNQFIIKELLETVFVKPAPPPWVCPKNQKPEGVSNSKLRPLSKSFSSKRKRANRSLRTSEKSSQNLKNATKDPSSIQGDQNTSEDASDVPKNADISETAHDVNEEEEEEEGGEEEEDDDSYDTSDNEEDSSEENETSNSDQKGETKSANINTQTTSKKNDHEPTPSTLVSSTQIQNPPMIIGDDIEINNQSSTRPPVPPKRIKFMDNNNSTTVQNTISPIAPPRPRSFVRRASPNKRSSEWLSTSQHVEELPKSIAVKKRSSSFQKNRKIAMSPLISRNITTIITSGINQADEAVEKGGEVIEALDKIPSHFDSAIFHLNQLNIEDEKKIFSPSDILDFNDFFQQFTCLESCYLVDLLHFQSELIIPGMKTKVITEDIHNSLFLNFLEILQLHSDFMLRLHNILKDVSENFLDLICNFFLDFSKKLADEYKYYCENQCNTFMENLLCIMRENPSFCSFLSETIPHVESSAKDLEYFMLLPYLQIQNYVPLMTQFKSIICYFLLSDEQTDILDRFHQNLGDMVVDINQLLYKRNPSLYELLQIHLSLVNSSNFRILNFGRYFYSKEEITIGEKLRTIYLFNDCLLILNDSLFILRFIYYHHIICVEEECDGKGIKITELGNHNVHRFRFSTSQRRKFVYSYLSSQCNQIQATSSFYSYLTSFCKSKYDFRSSSTNLKVEKKNNNNDDSETSSRDTENVKLRKSIRLSRKKLRFEEKKENQVSDDSEMTANNREILDIFFNELLPLPNIHSETEYEEEVLKFSLLLQFESNILQQSEELNETLTSKANFLEKAVGETLNTPADIVLLQQVVDYLTMENLRLQKKIKTVSNSIKQL